MADETVVKGGLVSSNEKLISLIKKLAYKEGKFILASGKESSFYIDIKNLSLHPEGAREIGQQAWLHLDPKQFDGVGGPTLGADPIGTAISLAALERGVTVPAFIIRKEPKSHGTTQWIEGTDNLKPGGRLLVLEDVVTTGGSSVKGIEKAREAGFKVDTLLCVMDRQEGGTEALSAVGVKLVSLATIAQVRESR